MITISNTIFLILFVLSILYIAWLWLWLFRPFVCNCGKQIWTRRAIKKHLNDKHFLK